MAGYFGYSKSNNALAAEENGMLPLSRITGAPRWAIKLAGELRGADEWHHTSNSGWFEEARRQQDDLKEITSR